MSEKYFKDLKRFDPWAGNLRSTSQILSGGLYEKMKIDKIKFNRVRKELFPEEFI